jgi:hypothetical protein
MLHEKYKDYVKKYGEFIKGNDSLLGEVIELGKVEDDIVNTVNDLLNIKRDPLLIAFREGLLDWQIDYSKVPSIVTEHMGKDENFIIGQVIKKLPGASPQKLKEIISKI